MVATKKEITAVNSFPSGSTAEPDDLKPMHIKSLLGCGTDGTGEAPKSAIIALVNMVLRGKIPIVVFASSFGVSLCASSKKEGE